MMKRIGMIWTLLWLAMPLAVGAQQPATPIPVNPPTATATAPPATDIPTRTPTSLGPASARAINDGTNVRAQPDISAERLGQMFAGQTLPIRGRFFEWLQIEFPDSPSGLGWVHQSVVNIEGDEALIPEINQGGLPTQDPAIANQQATLDAVTSTPGIVGTLTAEAGNAALGNPITLQAQPGDAAPVTGGGTSAPQSGNGNLPTYTFPAVTVTPLNLGDYTGQREVIIGEGGMPPMLPILGLAGIGILGMAISLLRRL